MHNDSRLALSILTISVTLPLFLFVIDSPLPAVARFALAVAILSGCGLAFMKLYKLEGWWGIILLRSKLGLDFLDRQSRAHPAFWQFFADVGLVIGYGACAYFLMTRGKSESKARLFGVFLTGAIALLVLSGIIASLASTALFSQLSGGEEFASAGSKLSADLSSGGLFRYFILAVMALGGLATLASVNVLIYAGVLLFAMIDALTGTSMRILTATPGGVPLIPGKNIPLFEGIGALAVVLAVHEALHGIVARLYKLPLKSAGLVFFGFLPFGAFVDIDEKKLAKESREKQNAVFVAGTAANFATSIIFLLVLILFIGATNQFRVEGVSQLKYAPGFEWLSAVRSFLLLTFALNFVVGVINLIPLPLFDGYHIMRNGVRDKRIASFIAYAIAAAFIVSMLPWVLR